MSKKTKKKAGKRLGTTVSKAITAPQEAQRVTWTLKGHLKNAQISYLRVGALLVRVKNENLFGALGHPTIADYADKRLSLGQSSLYKYIQVYEWVSAKHPEWLKPKPKGFIPDLSDAANLIRIESDLATTTLTPTLRATLEALQKKGLAGHLTQDEVERTYRAARTSHIQDSLNAFVASVRALRKRGARLANIPPEAISHLDAVIDVLTHDQALARMSFPKISARLPVRVSA